LKALTSQELYQRAISYHGTEHYDYTNTDFSSLKTDTSVYCNYCEKEFPVNLGRHLSTKKPSGCPSCKFKKLSKLYMMSEEDFKEDCRKVHNGYYLYPEGITIYKGNKESIFYICPEHGLREQNAGKHKSGQGCALCEGSYKRSLEDIHDYMNKHKEMFSDIELLSTEYINHNTLMQWRCLIPNCGYEWAASWGKVKGTGGRKGRRCPECAGLLNDTKAEKHKDKWVHIPAMVYVLECLDEDNTLFYKIGYTQRTVDVRYYDKRVKFTYKVLKEYKSNKYECVRFEKRLLRAHTDNIKKYKPVHKFHGHTECYTELLPWEVIDDLAEKIMPSWKQ